MENGFSMAVSQSSFDFLADLRENNNREWFQVNRHRYEQAKKELEQLVEFLLTETEKLQPLGPTKVKDCIFRIYRDIRFSKDKTPYKKFLSAAIGPGGRGSGRIDYYLHLEPNNQSFLGAGMWSPTSAQLQKYRQEIDYNAAELKGIIEAEEFRTYFPEVLGEIMKTAPKGYPKDHEEIALLRRKELFFIHRFTDEEVLQDTFKEQVMEGIKLLKPFCDFLNYIFFDEGKEI